MDSNDDIKLLLMEEQTLLSRERTMHSYMQTGSSLYVRWSCYHEVSGWSALFLHRHILYYPGLPSHRRSGEAVCALQEGNPETPR